MNKPNKFKWWLFCQLPSAWIHLLDGLLRVLGFGIWYPNLDFKWTAWFSLQRLKGNWFFN